MAQIYTLALAKRLRDAARFNDPISLLNGEDYTVLNAVSLPPAFQAVPAEKLAGDRWFWQSTELLLISKFVQDEALAASKQMPQAQIDLIRKITREAVPEIVAGVTCYKQAHGIKFWCVHWHAISCEDLVSKVQAALLKHAPMLEVKVYAGSYDTWHSAPCLYVMDTYAPAPKLVPWKPEKKPTVFAKPQATLSSLFPLKGKPLNVGVPITTLRKWKQTLDHLGEEVTRDSLGEVKAITAEMQQFLRA